MILLLSSLPQKSGCLAGQMRKTPDHGWIPKNMYLSTRFKEIQAAQIPCICEFCILQHFVKKTMKKLNQMTRDFIYAAI